VTNIAHGKIAEEFGDLLFADGQSRAAFELDPETALRDANAKFMRAFVHRLGLKARGPNAGDASLAMRWRRCGRKAKKAERE